MRLTQITCFQNVFSISSSKFSPVRNKVLFMHALNMHSFRQKITKRSSHYSIFGMLFKQHKFINTWGTGYNIISLINFKLVFYSFNKTTPKNT